MFGKGDEGCGEGFGGCWVGVGSALLCFALFAVRRGRVAEGAG